MYWVYPLLYNLYVLLTHPSLQPQSYKWELLGCQWKWGETAHRNEAKLNIIIQFSTIHQNDSLHKKKTRTCVHPCVIWLVLVWHSVTERTTPVFITKIHSDQPLFNYSPSSFSWLRDLQIQCKINYLYQIFFTTLHVIWFTTEITHQIAVNKPWCSIVTLLAFWWWHKVMHSLSQPLLLLHVPLVWCLVCGGLTTAVSLVLDIHLMFTT